MQYKILYNDVDNIIYQFKAELEHRNKFKKIVKEINKLTIGKCLIMRITNDEYFKFKAGIIFNHEWCSILIKDFIDDGGGKVEWILTPRINPFDKFIYMVNL